MEATSTERAAGPASVTPAGSTNPWVRTFNRVFSRHLTNLVLLLMLPILLVPTLSLGRTLLVDPDIWWHLADARFLFTTHHFIQTDPYSFTVVGQRWLNWEWLGELPFWFAFQSLGLRGIYLVTWLGLGANVLFLYWRGYLISRHAGAAFWAAGIAIFLMAVNAGPRTIAFAYLAMSAEMAIFEASERGHRKLVWLLPPLFCLWVNLHGTWFIGICLLALYIVCGMFDLKLGVFEQKAFAPGDRNRLLAVLGASTVLLLLNPYGWRLLWNPLDMMLNQKVSVATITEWQPLALSSLEGRAALIAIVLMIIANCIRGRKWKIYEMAIVFLSWYAAFAHHRFTYLAAILTTPMLARDIKRSFTAGSDEKTIPAMNAAIIAAAMGVMVWMYPSEAALKDMLAKMFPLQMIATIQPSWRTLDWDYVGGMMDFESKPNFMDSRYDSFEHAGVMQDEGKIMDVNDSLELMDKYRIDHALLLEGMGLSYLLQRTPGWRVVMREKAWEGNYILYAKVPGAPPPACVPAQLSGRH